MEVLLCNDSYSCTNFFLVKIRYVIQCFFSLFQVANALGYIHAKNITHGRLCSRNIFLEHKVQLSLLDYTIGQSNLVYSSPQLLQVKYQFIFSFYLYCQKIIIVTELQMAQNCILNRYYIYILKEAIYRYLLHKCKDIMKLFTDQRKLQLLLSTYLHVMNIFFQKLDQNSFWFIGFVRASSRFNELLTTKFKMTSTTISY